MQDDEERAVRGNHHAQCTAVLVDAVKTLTNRDFTKMMGSGVVITLHDLGGKLITERFMVAGEDMEAIKFPIISSIKNSLNLRRIMLQGEIRDIDNLIGPP